MGPPTRSANAALARALSPCPRKMLRTGNDKATVVQPVPPRLLLACPLCGCAALARSAGLSGAMLRVEESDHARAGALPPPGPQQSTAQLGRVFS